MTQHLEFSAISTCIFSDFLDKSRVMSGEIRPLQKDVKRVAGPAFTIRCPRGDNLMLHAAIHRAPAGSVIVIESEDCDFAVAGGNVCRVAQKNGIRAFVIDGAIRDVEEIREIEFPVFSKALSPIPGGKERLDVFNNGPVSVGGIQVNPGDYIVADEEGIVAIPALRATELLEKAKAKQLKDSEESLESWEAKHKNKIEEILKKKGFSL